MKKRTQWPHVFLAYNSIAGMLLKDDHVHHGGVVGHEDLVLLPWRLNPVVLDDPRPRHHEHCAEETDDFTLEDDNYHH